MRLLAVGCSFRTAPLALRERLAYPEAEVAGALRDLLSLEDIQEVVLVSTCNRVEVWAVVDRVQHAARAVRRFFATSRQLPEEELRPVLYQHEDREAVSHIFRVASSLDAMVVGEAQITGQVKEAYAAASRTHTVGALLNRCMHRAFATAKRVRTETHIARHPVSVSSVAADLAVRVLGDLSRASVLVVGAGEMAELAVRHLLSDGATQIRVVNRTWERATQLAFQLGAKAARFEDLEGQLLLAEIVITSTGSTEPVLTRSLVSRVMRQRKQRPLVIVDIAVPKDVEAEVASLANVYLFNIDDLEQVVAENLKERQKEARQAERILRVEVDRFVDWMRKQDAVPVIKDLRRHFTEIARAEAERTAHALKLDGTEGRELLDTMADAIVKKLLHDPSMELKDNANRPDGTFLARATRRLFHLPDADGEAAADEVAGAAEEERE